MKVDEILLQRLEKLSFLQISEENRAEMINQMSEIVSFVDNLSELNTDGISPTFSMENAATLLREDMGSVDQAINDDILNHSPHAQEHFFIVPKIIE
jgi:aspartyl-tRNA(Asn)/glutamyl-tRNA(Gln) amidotransferase subunit C